jgi:hypothetical protein
VETGLAVAVLHFAEWHDLLDNVVWSQNISSTA